MCSGLRFPKKCHLFERIDWSFIIEIQNEEIKRWTVNSSCGNRTTGQVMRHWFMAVHRLYCPAQGLRVTLRLFHAHVFSFFVSTLLSGLCFVCEGLIWGQPSKGQLREINPDPGGTTLFLCEYLQMIKPAVIHSSSTTRPKGLWARYGRICQRYLSLERFPVALLWASACSESHSGDKIDPLLLTGWDLAQKHTTNYTLSRLCTRRNSFERAVYSCSWMSGGFIGQGLVNGEVKDRACRCLIWTKVGWGGWSARVSSPLTH